jgi:hypothetical protein
MGDSSSPLSRRGWLLAIASFFTLAAGPASESNPIALIVRSDLPLDNLPFTEVRRLMLGDRQFWSSSLKITLLMRAPGAREREIVLKDIYQMSEAQFRQYWIAKVFRAEAASGPRIVYSNQMATELVAQIPGAVAFVDASQVPAGLKIMKINGHLPGEPGYPLR